VSVAAAAAAAVLAYFLELDRLLCLDGEGVTAAWLEFGRDDSVAVSGEISTRSASSLLFSVVECLLTNRLLRLLDGEGMTLVCSLVIVGGVGCLELVVGSASMRSCVTPSFFDSAACFDTSVVFEDVAGGGDVLPKLKKFSSFMFQETCDFMEHVSSSEEP